MTSLAASSMACVVGLLCWWQSVPGLWEIATFTPTRPIRPMGLAGYLVLGVFGSFIGWLLVGLVGTLSRRPAAEVAVALGMVAVLLPLLNFVLFWMIVLVRGIELST